jgi:hypothetical protein
MTGTKTSDRFDDRLTTEGHIHQLDVIKINLNTAAWNTGNLSLEGMSYALPLLDTPTHIAMHIVAERNPFHLIH